MELCIFLMLCAVNRPVNAFSNSCAQVEELALTKKKKKIKILEKHVFYMLDHL